MQKTFSVEVSTTETLEGLKESKQEGRRKSKVRDDSKKLLENLFERKIKNIYNPFNFAYLECMRTHARVQNLKKQEL